MDAHKQVRKEILPLQSLLATPSWKLAAVLPQIADSLAILQEKLYPQFDAVEDVINQTARQIPLETVKAMDARLEECRRQNSRKQGTVWAAFYLTRALSPEERELGALRMPKHKLEGMLTAGELQFRR
jgi:Mg2+ and Co2+ transporter CorA